MFSKEHYVPLKALISVSVQARGNVESPMYLLAVAQQYHNGTSISHTVTYPCSDFACFLCILLWTVTYFYSRPLYQNIYLIRQVIA